MKINVTKAWCEKMARREAYAEIGAGLLAVDPIFDNEFVPETSGDDDMGLCKRCASKIEFEITKNITH